MLSIFTLLILLLIFYTICISFLVYRVDISLQWHVRQDKSLALRKIGSQP
jgi:hypothetical protein